MKPIHELMNELSGIEDKERLIDIIPVILVNEEMKGKVYFLFH